jgi:hypothetical protein
MLCYRGMTFCSQFGCAADCSRRMTQEISDAATAAQLPVALAQLRDTEYCPGFVAEKSEKSLLQIPIRVDKVRGSCHSH